jgi:ACS family tartrate transporter-like MFS transporter
MGLAPDPTDNGQQTTDNRSALDRARAKAYLRLLPILFLGYAIAYVDRINISLAALRMTVDLPGFTNEVIGFGGIFFIGYFILEIPGTLLVEKWSARKWICRIMVTWGIVAALTAFVKTPFHFYLVRFFLGLAEAGFFPGVIVYLTHWFPARDRGRALSWFFIATPVAQLVSPKLSYFLLRIGTTETSGGVTIAYPALWGMQGWQWMYIAWGIPAVILGFLVLFKLPDWPKDARWLEPDERDALEQELRREKEQHKQGHGHMTILQAFQHPKVLLLAAAYFFVVSTSYGVETFLPKILEKWYALNLSDLTWALTIPPLGGLAGQLLVGWSSDRTGERRLHGSIPIYLGAAALAGALVIPASLSFAARLALAVFLFTVALMGLKSYMPAFWALPNLILTEAAAAGSIGLINSLGNLGGFVGPYVLGYAETRTHSFVPGLMYLCVSMAISATIIFTLGLGHRAAGAPAGAAAEVHPLFDEETDSLVEPV